MAEWVAVERKYGHPFLTKENPSYEDPHAITVECDIAMARRMARALNVLDAKDASKQESACPDCGNTGCRITDAWRGPEWKRNVPCYCPHGEKARDVQGAKAGLE